MARGTEGLLFTSSRDETVKRSHLTSGEILGTLAGHAHVITRVAAGDTEGPSSPAPTTRPWSAGTSRTAASGRAAEHIHVTAFLAALDAEGILSTGSLAATRGSGQLPANAKLKDTPALTASRATEAAQPVPTDAVGRSGDSQEFLTLLP